MLFREFAEFCERLEKISSTLELAARIAELLKKIEDEKDLYDVVLFILGKVYPPWDERELGVGVGLIYEALENVSGVKKAKIEEMIRELGDLGLAAEKLIEKKKMATLAFEELTIRKVRDTFDEMSSLTGEGSRKRKIMLLTGLYGLASPMEAKYLTRLILSEMRLGVGEGIMRDAIARAFGADSEIVERAYMITNDLGKVAVVAKNEGEKGLKNMSVQIHVPVRMMLAQVAEGVKEALDEMKVAAVEWKFDGSRVQVHWDGKKVTIYSRRLENVTNALPEMVEEIKKCIKPNVILDGEIIAVKDGRPMPFQHVLRRFRRKHDVGKMVEKIPLEVHFFDVLYSEGEVIDLPLKERRKILESVIEESEKIKIAVQTITDNVKKVETIYRQAVDAGHEGVMIKNPSSPYVPGKRGKHWLKLKAVMETLDLVVVGGEWGEGKRSHWLSSFELACVDTTTGSLLRVGKVATGFTEEDLEEMTELFKPLIVSQEGKKVEFIPKYVFEVAYQEIQKSPKYESGYALRFPRFIRLRDDKDVDEADTIERVENLYKMQFELKKQ
ncbi:MULTISPECIES: ATP-dependent DNA ligase [unclassified Archaeoglobus]|jgi:DNA ligase-1|uniref:ATP-dependent DNA ligase n=1 Tax=unclassified Archaeoglobus TaxID=2643606 RepID=UPI0025BE3072|nr:MULTISPECIES: ATP-dependent DNA ligase [unclassified Archaeoglobus]